MRSIKLIVAILLVLGVASISFADSVPQAVDPENYPVVYTANVYNGSGSDIASGMVVQWDFDTADSTALDGSDYDDMCPYVKTADAAEDIWTAGVIPLNEGISNGDEGIAIIRGPAVVYMGSGNSGNCNANELTATDSSGYATDWTGAGSDEATLGVCIKASAAGNDVGADATADYALIFIDPVRYSDD